MTRLSARRRVVAIVLVAGACSFVATLAAVLGLSYASAVIGREM